MAIRPGKNIKLKTPAKDAAKEATLARNDDDALKTPPRTDGAATGKETGGSSLDVFNAPAAGSAASKAAAAREAAAKPLDNETPGLAREEERTGTNEASTGIAERLNEGFEDILDRAGKEVLGEDMGAGEQEDDTEASRDSGKGGLQRLVDEAFPADDGASESSGAGGSVAGESGGGGGGSGSGAAGATAGGGSGSAGGSMGTPEDLGVTGAIGPKGDLDSGSDVGLDVFNVNLSGLRGSTAASGDSDELGLLQGIVPETGGASAGKPSVADGGMDTLDNAVGGVGGAAGVAGAIAGAAGAAAVAGGAGVIATGAGAYSAARALDDATGFGQGLVEGIARSTEHAKTDEMRAVLAHRARVEADHARMDERAKQILLDKAIDENIQKQYELEQRLKQGQTPVDADTTNASGTGESKQGTSPGAGQPGDPGPEGSDTNGWENALKGAAWRAAGRARLGISQGGSGDIDPSEGGAAEAVHSGPAPTPLEAGQAQKAMREFLVGQPSGTAVGGGGSIGAGTRPGDSGDIDPGEGHTGAWTSDTRTESESEALDSFGGSGLTIGDAHRKDDEDDEEENEDDSGDES